MKLLADPDAWWRETAQRLLFERQDRSVVGELRAMVAERPSALGRLHALWTLELLASLDTVSIELGLTDPEPRVREASHPAGGSPAGARAGVARDGCWPWPAIPIRWSASSSPFHWVRSRPTRERWQRWRRSPEQTPRTNGLGRPCSARSPVVHSRSWMLSAKQDGFVAAPAAKVWLDELAFLVGCGRKPEDARAYLDRLSRCRTRFGRADARHSGPGPRPGAERGLIQVAS